MTLNLSAIFGAETSDAMIVAQVMVPPAAAGATVAYPGCATESDVTPPIINAWPIIPGTEHFSIWIDDPDGPWPKFVPGYHHDIRQPSQLRPLCSPRKQINGQAPNTEPQQADREAVEMFEAERRAHAGQQEQQPF